MEVGESVCVAVPDNPPDVEFEAKIVSVTFNGNALVAWNNAAVSGPHWEEGKEAALEDVWAWADKLALPKYGFSKKPAAYFGGGDYTLDVKVSVTKSVNVSGAGTLIGNLGGVKIKGSCPTGAGEHVVSAKFEDVPEGIRALVGAIGWGLEIPSASLDYGLGSTLAEVYLLLAKPTAPHAKGVWAEVLRFLCSTVGLSGEKEPEKVAITVTGYCHTQHGLKYDTVEGGSFFGSAPMGTGAFLLRAYVLKQDVTCNCYDQAAAVQVLSGAVGVTVGWLHLAPYGYIKTTNLVGIGSCNNPFFTATGSKPLVPRDSPRRTAFGNHSFCSAPSSKILDACAGPHRATESREQYVTASVDDGRDVQGLHDLLYAGELVGTAAMMVNGPGAVGIVW